MPLPVPLPTRVSRLYPVFSLVFLLSSATFLYAWQRDQIEISRLASFEQREKALHDQIDGLISDKKLDQAKIQVQKQNIADTTAKLQAIQEDLKKQTEELTKAQGDLKSAQDQLKKQQDQLSSNASELERLRSRPPLFSFQNKSTSIQNVAQKEEDAKQLISTAYDYVQNLYDKPYLLNSITITFVDQFSIPDSSGEIVIQNGPKGISIDIHLKDFNKTSFQDVNTVIHEMIHGFHGAAVFETTAFEEGMTVAAADAVMERMIADHKLPPFTHLYLVWNDDQYAAWNSSLTVHSDNQAFYSDPNVGKVYQLIGNAWFKLYKESPDIFKKINQSYYPKVQQGKTPDSGMVLDAIRANIKQVGSQSIDAFLAGNAAFNPR